MLCVLVNIRFQVLFHSPPGVLFTFPSQYCSTIGHQVVFRLGGWSPHLPIGFHVPDGTLDTVCRPSLRLQDSHLLWLAFPHHSAWLDVRMTVRTPAVLLPPVWPLPLSLATTRGISVDFSSSRYLDVSVPGVPLIYLCIQYMIHGSSPCVFPHSEICGYNAYLQLPAAYRSLSRPSSALDAKAFTLCSFLLELPIRFSHSLELLEFQNMGFIFSHLKGFPFSALFVIPPCGEIVVFVTLNFRKDLDLFDFAIVVSKNLLISKSFVFFLTICSFLYSFFIRFSMNRSSS